jgi:hypothetical protein
MVNCSSTIWILPWSNQALNEVATFFFTTEGQAFGFEDDLQENVVQICV